MVHKSHCNTLTELTKCTAKILKTFTKCAAIYATFT